MRTDAEVRAAYDAWQGGATWAEVAESCRYPTANAALMSVRRFAELNRLPLRRATPVPDKVRLRRSYCAYLLGWEWAEIAALQGWASGASVQASVTRYACSHGLPLRRLP